MRLAIAYILDHSANSFIGHLTNWRPAQRTITNKSPWQAAATSACSCIHAHYLSCNCASIYPRQPSRLCSISQKWPRVLLFDWQASYEHENEIWEENVYGPSCQCASRTYISL